MMRLPYVRITVRWLMMVVAIVAMIMGAIAGFSIEQNGVTGVITGWVALYCIPVILIIGRRISTETVIHVSGRIVLPGLPIASLFGLFSYAMSGFVGLIGGFILAILVIGWFSLLAAAFWAYEGSDVTPP
jgi:hypothetical protein